MNIKEKIITIIITIMSICLMGMNFFANTVVSKINELYVVYLNGSVIGYIENDDELYNMINSKQEEIKRKYNVKNVYPPSSFKIIKSKSYNATISPASSIYTQMAKNGSFTIEGYQVKISSDSKKPKIINILNKNIFDKSIDKFVKAFLTEEEYTNYMNETQPPIDGTGKLIELVYFDETITIKKSRININEKIYLTEKDLSQYLLFGDNYKISKYEVLSGDTIESISENNKLNTAEFLVANPKYTSSESLLTVGDKVNITLINPVLTLTYEVNEISDTKIPFEKKVEYDNSKPSSYNEITTPGVTGITRVAQHYAVKNGEMQSGVKIDSQQVITEKVDQVTTMGAKSSWSSGGSGGGAITGSYIDTGEQWQWPTNYPYVITSNFEYRWGVLHEGIDISGTGYNSPIYAALDGVVISSGWGGMCGNSAGNCIVIQHANGYCTMYAHLASGSLRVSNGQSVSRGQVIAGMGSTGVSTGTHLHFSTSTGVPYSGGKFFNPKRLWQ